MMINPCYKANLLSCSNIKYNDCIAQWREQRAFNSEVMGSSPIAYTHDSINSISSFCITWKESEKKRTTSTKLLNA